MKLPKHLWNEITSYDNLHKAARATLANGRRFQGDGAQFQFQLEKHLHQLQHDLRARTYRHGNYRGFTVYEPKKRLILAAPIRDRVVHHALHDVIAPLMDRGFIFDSYACRPGKGTHRAVQRAYSFLQANEYFLHLDVRKFFPSLPHANLKDVVRRSVHEEPVLWLFNLIIDSSLPPESRQKKYPHQLSFFEDRELIRGLPIGNLTSQFLANLYLNELDQYVKHTLSCRHYLRYMDDFVLFGNDRAVLEEQQSRVEQYCSQKLALTLHEKGGVKTHSEGLGFLGFRIFRTHKRIKGPALTRFIRKARHRWREVGCGHRMAASFEAGRRSWLNHAAQGDTHGLILSLKKKYPMMRNRNPSDE